MMMPTMGNKMIHKVNTTLLIGSKSFLLKTENRPKTSTTTKINRTYII